MAWLRRRFLTGIVVMVPVLVSVVTLGWVFTHADTEHAARQREHRIASFPEAARRYLA